MIFVTSIPSTGTNFLLSLLGPHESIHELPKKIKRGEKHHSVVFTHLHQTYNHIILEYAQKYRTIVPLRDPLAAATTWASRYSMGWQEAKNRFLSWHQLAQLDKKANIEYLPVDLPRRDEALAKLGLSLETDWHPVNQSPPHPLKAQYRAGRIPDLPEKYLFALQDVEESIRPLLEREGYKDLLWWS